MNCYDEQQANDNDACVLFYDNLLMKRIQMNIAKLLCAAFVSLVSTSILAGNDEVSAFKAYLSKPPIVSRLVYTERAVCDDNQFQNRDFIAAYSGTAFYVEHFTSRDNIDFPISESNKMHGSMFVGRSGDVRWQINGFSVGESISQIQDKPDAYAAFSDTVWFILSGILSFGPQEIQPGSFTWAGNKFEARPSAMFRQAIPNADIMTGFISVEGGRVTQMDILYKSRLSSRFTYKYDTSADHPNWFPSEIKRAGTPDCVCVQIHQVVFGNEYDLAGRFVPEVHIKPRLELLTVVSNDQIIAAPAQTDPTVVSLIKIQNSRSGLVRKTYLPINFIKIGFVLLILLPLIYIVYTHLKSKKAAIEHVNPKTNQKSKRI